MTLLLGAECGVQAVGDRESQLVAAALPLVGGAVVVVGSDAVQLPQRCRESGLDLLDVELVGGGEDGAGSCAHWRPPLSGWAGGSITCPHAGDTAGFRGSLPCVVDEPIPSTALLGALSRVDNHDWS
jgi:hypothetical protein